MALHRLGDESYKNFQYSPKLWKGILRESPSDLVGDMFPKISKETSLHENRTFCWFFGRVQIEGQGSVEVIYPYSYISNVDFTVRNVDFSTFSYLLLKARPEPGWEFQKWCDSVTLETLTGDQDLLLSEFTYPEVTGFTAIFRKDASDVGI